MKYNLKIPFILLLLLCTVTVGATSPTAWDTSIPYVYFPPCASGSVKHFEVPMEYVEKATNIQIFDAMKAAGYTNLRYQFTSGSWVWSGDCTLGT